MQVKTLEQLTARLKPRTKAAMESAIAAARAAAEIEITRTLAKLEHQTMCKVGAVEINTDYPKGCTVEIFFKLGDDSVIR